MCLSHVRCSSKIIPKNLVDDVRLISKFKKSILLGRLIRFLLDLNIVKEDLLLFRVNLLELN